MTPNRRQKQKLKSVPSDCEVFATKDILIPSSLFSKHSGYLFLCAIVCNEDTNTGGLFLSPPLCAGTSPIPAPQHSLGLRERQLW